MKGLKKNKRKLLSALLLLTAVALLSACGEEEAAEKFFGITYSQENADLSPAQIICTQENAWAITTVKNDFIYKLTNGSGAATEKLTWQPAEDEYYLINIAERDGVLYAEFYGQEQESVEIRKYSDGAWTDVMSVTQEEDGWYVVGGGFFVDGSENVYLVNGNQAARFGKDGKQSWQQKLSGSVCFFEENEEGTAECVTAEGNHITLYELTEGGAKEKWTRQEAEPVGKVCGIGSSEGETLCLATNQELLFLDRETGNLLAKTELVKLGVSSVLTGYYDAGEGTLQLYESMGNGAGLRYRLLTETEDAAEQRTEVVYGMVSGVNAATDSCIWTAISAFNSESEDYYVTIKNYDGNLDRLHADMAAGTAPDILDMTYAEYYESYVENGYLEDLTQYLEQSEYRDDMIWNVLDAYQIDGGLYAFIPQFLLEGLLIHPDYEPLVEEWNMETFLALIEENQWEKDLFGLAGSPDDLLSKLLYENEEEWVDWERQTASFESEEFLNLLALCKEYSKEYQATGEEQALNSLCESEIYGQSFAWYLGGVGAYGREYPIYGYPTRSGQTYGISACYNACAIYSGSSEKEGAWEFIESLLWDSNQKYTGIANPGFPIRKSMLEEVAEESKDVQMKINGELLTITDSEIGILEDIIYNGNVNRTSMNPDIKSVVEEEAAAYFAGDKSAEEVAHIIQSRVEIILQE